MITPTYTAEFCVFPRATHASVSRARDKTGRKRNETIHPRRDALRERNETKPRPIARIDARVALSLRLRY